MPILTTGDGVRLHYTDDGKGRALALPHRLVDVGRTGGKSSASISPNAPRHRARPARTGRTRSR